jgi:hypothetical protein
LGCLKNPSKIGDIAYIFNPEHEAIWESIGRESASLFPVHFVLKVANGIQSDSAAQKLRSRDTFPFFMRKLQSN